MIAPPRPFINLYSSHFFDEHHETTDRSACVCLARRRQPTTQAGARQRARVEAVRLRGDGAACHARHCRRRRRRRREHWLDVNGEAIYGTHAWTQFGENDGHFTVKDGALYAIGTARGAEVHYASIASSAQHPGKVTRIERLDRAGALPLALKLTGLTLR